jgi:RNA exonuclease 1
VKLLTKASPTLRLTLQNLKGDGSAVGMKDMRSFLVSLPCLGSGPSVTWIDLKLSHLIKHVSLIIVDSLTHDLFLDASSVGLMPYLSSSSFLHAPTKAPGNANRVMDGFSVLLRHPLSKSMLKALKRERRQDIDAINSLASPQDPSSSSMDIDQLATESSSTSMPHTASYESSNAKKQENGSSTTTSSGMHLEHTSSEAHRVNSDKSNVSGTKAPHHLESNGTYTHIVGPAKTVEDLASRLDISQRLAERSTFKETSILSPIQCLMSINELHSNLYPLPSTITEEGYICIPKYRSTTLEKAIMESKRPLSKIQSSTIPSDDAIIDTETNPSADENQTSSKTLETSDTDASNKVVSAPSSSAVPQSSDTPQKASSIPFHILAIDCEMCKTAVGIELTRVVVVNLSLETVYDAYVKPKHHVVDYLTRYSGISEEDLKDVTIDLVRVQKDLLSFIHPHTILIGHSLENDLKALKISHFRVIDTALLYPHTRGETFKNSLKFLAENWLQEVIQTSHHDPTQDAVTAMKLALLKIRKGSQFGILPASDGEENLCEYFSRKGLRTAIVDNLHSCKLYAGSHTDLIAEESDVVIAQKAQRTLATCKYEFTFTRFRALERYYASLEQDYHAQNNQTLDPMSVPEADREKERQICAELDSHIRTVLSKAPKRTLVIISGGHGNLARVRTIINRKKKSASANHPWSEAEEIHAKAVLEKARETISFFYITPETSTISPPTTTS